MAEVTNFYFLRFSHFFIDNNYKTGGEYDLVPPTPIWGRKIYRVHSLGFGQQIKESFFDLKTDFSWKGKICFQKVLK